MATAITHRTGYRYRFNAVGRDKDGNPLVSVVSWHRTFRGALKAKRIDKYRGHIYRITSADTSERIELYV